MKNAMDRNDITRILLSISDDTWDECAGDELDTVVEMKLADYCGDFHEPDFVLTKQGKRWLEEELRKL